MAQMRSLMFVSVYMLLYLSVYSPAFGSAASDLYGRGNMFFFSFRRRSLFIWKCLSDYAAQCASHCQISRQGDLGACLCVIQ